MAINVQYDGEGAGTMCYKDLMKVLLEEDQFAFYALP